MSSVAYILVVLISLEIQVQSKPTCEEDALSISDLGKAKDGNRQEQISRELSSDDGESVGEDGPAQETTGKSSDEGQELSCKMSTDNGTSDLKKAMEDEGSDQHLKGAMNKRKREICDRILEQLREIPCDNPVMITCGGENRVYPCVGDQPESPLRSALSEVDNILGAAEGVPPQSAFSPSILPSSVQMSPVQTLPISSPAMVTNLLPGVRGILSQDVQPSPPYMPSPRILTAEERRERQKGIFEGLLRFGTVVNHIDSFLTDKSKMIIRGLHRMVQSEEDSRFT